MSERTKIENFLEKYTYLGPKLIRDIGSMVERSEIVDITMAEIAILIQRAYKGDGMVNDVWVYTKRPKARREKKGGIEDSPVGQFITIPETPVYLGYDVYRNEFFCCDKDDFLYEIADSIGLRSEDLGVKSVPASVYL